MRIKQIAVSACGVAGLLMLLNACVPPPPNATPCPSTITAGVGGDMYAPNSCTLTLGGASKTVTIQASADHPLDTISTNWPTPIVAATVNQSVTFTAPGAYTYKCHIHGVIGMTGTITVTN
jgi:plastocyanin